MQEIFQEEYRGELWANAAAHAQIGAPSLIRELNSASRDAARSRCDEVDRAAELRVGRGDIARISPPKEYFRPARAANQPWNAGFVAAVVGSCLAPWVVESSPESLCVFFSVFIEAKLLCSSSWLCVSGRCQRVSDLCTGEEDEWRQRPSRASSGAHWLAEEAGALGGPLHQCSHCHYYTSFYHGSSSRLIFPGNVHLACRSAVRISCSWSWNDITRCPSGAVLSCLEQVQSYLMSDITCKCGLECPLVLHKVFNFEVSAPVQQRSAEDEPALEEMKLCIHKRKLLAMAALRRSLQLPLNVNSCRTAGASGTVPAQVFRVRGSESENRIPIRLFSPEPPDTVTGFPRPRISNSGHGSLLSPAAPSFGDSPLSPRTSPAHLPPCSLGRPLHSNLPLSPPTPAPSPGIRKPPCSFLPQPLPCARQTSEKDPLGILDPIPSKPSPYPASTHSQVPMMNVGIPPAVVPLPSNLPLPTGKPGGQAPRVQQCQAPPMSPVPVYVGRQEASPQPCASLPRSPCHPLGSPRSALPSSPREMSAPHTQMLSPHSTNSFPASSLLSAAAKAQLAQQNRMVGSVSETPLMGEAPSGRVALRDKLIAQQRRLHVNPDSGLFSVTGIRPPAEQMRRPARGHTGASMAQLLQSLSGHRGQSPGVAPYSGDAPVPSNQCPLSPGGIQPLGSNLIQHARIDANQPTLSTDSSESGSQMTKSNTVDIMANAGRTYQHQHPQEHHHQQQYLQHHHPTQQQLHQQHHLKQQQHHHHHHPHQVPLSLQGATSYPNTRTNACFYPEYQGCVSGDGELYQGSVDVAKEVPTLSAFDSSIGSGQPIEQGHVANTASTVSQASNTSSTVTHSADTTNTLTHIAITTSTVSYADNSTGSGSRGINVVSHNSNTGCHMNSSTTSPALRGSEQRCEAWAQWNETGPAPYRGDEFLECSAQLRRPSLAEQIVAQTLGCGNRNGSPGSSSLDLGLMNGHLNGHSSPSSARSLSSEEELRPPDSPSTEIKLRQHGFSSAPLVEVEQLKTLTQELQELDRASKKSRRLVFEVEVEQLKTLTQELQELDRASKKSRRAGKLNHHHHLEAAIHEAMSELDKISGAGHQNRQVKLPKPKRRKISR
ncbi:hypothetical protein DNTS_031847 [Danionella cerebrum]|uniref:Uncharacterized protein n=1 Tax=Danionella cerebrum TaxID=2873325 RepID=A0A553MSZ6_9TELE|nr:hypothetical protein DNTS_031847 [Danionella translucida]TRY56305.1 hypothetical protein DNTS_031847 [Danionella translucida]